MNDYSIYWESEIGLACFECKAVSTYEAKKLAEKENPEILDCLIEIQESEI